MAREVNKAFLVLIPKVQHTVTFSQFCLINLCNFLYKIVFTILINRLCPFLEQIISPNEGAFVKGRWIVENTIIVHEGVHKVQKYKGRNDLMIIKIDLQKACDMLE